MGTFEDCVFKELKLVPGGAGLDHQLDNIFTSLLNASGLGDELTAITEKLWRY